MPHAVSHKFERLPSHAVPSHYVVNFKPDLVKCVFEGQVSIDLQVKIATQRLVLNSVDLELRHIELHLNDGTLYLPSKVLMATKCETFAIVFASEIPAGRCKLSISFKGTLDDSLKGFYRSKYTSHDTKEERYCAVTQFAPCYAHRCFPCWDEPAIKATFDISLHIPKDKVALSNMPVLREEDLPDGSKLVCFETTPIMSTYLVAIVVGDFDYIEELTPDNVRVRVYTPVGKQDQGQFALETAVKVLPYFKDYFKIPYPLPKIDLVAIGSFCAGAMENWGLVTYRETCLLVDQDITSTLQKQWVALFVAHELAHQWFGNLVTMEWWTHLWLNEGYATFAEYISVADLFPEYDMWTQFVTKTFCPALKLDALKNSHPVEVPVGHPLEVQEIFDDISYHKGASVIRMLHRFIGDQDFAKGMNLYLSKFQYGNATTDDLWNALEEASNKPISQVMPLWTRQKGYPVITVTSEIDGNKRKLFLKQSQFLADGMFVEPEESKLWMIPIEFSSARAPQAIAHAHMMCAREAIVCIEGIKENDWVKLNPGNFGFYRVQYSSEMLQMFKPAILNSALPPLDRLGLLEDLIALVQAGHSSTDQVLQMLDSMQNENNYLVWSSISSVLIKIQKLLQYAEDVQPLFMAFGRELLDHVGQLVSWDPVPNETHRDKLLRNVVLDLLCVFNDETAVQEAKKRFEDHINGTVPMWPDIRSTVYRSVLRKADKSTYEAFLKMYRDETLEEEKERISTAFGSIEDGELLKQALAFALSDEVRTQTTLSILGAVAQSKTGREMVWEYTKANWDKLRVKYGAFFILPRFITDSFQHFASEDMADQLEDFFSTKDTSGTERALQQTIERIRINAAWLHRDSESIKTFLQNS